MSGKPLDHISTMWTALHEAHGGTPREAEAARQLLLERYGPAVRDYLSRKLTDPNDVDDLVQEFAVALISGRFRHADRDRGRFRSYLKTTLFHLVGAQRKQARRVGYTLAAGVTPVEQPCSDADLDFGFDESWRNQLLVRSWDALAQTRPHWHTVLRFKVKNPDMPSQEMAQVLSQTLGEPLSADGVRQTIRRARYRLADLLLQEVADSLQSRTRADLEEELAELRLLELCQPALTRLYPPPAPSTG